MESLKLKEIQQGNSNILKHVDMAQGQIDLLFSFFVKKKLVCFCIDNRVQSGKHEWGDKKAYRRDKSTFWKE